MSKRFPSSLARAQPTIAAPIIAIAISKEFPLKNLLGIKNRGFRGSLMQQGEIRGHSIFLISIIIERLTTEKLWKVLKEARNWGKANPNKVTSKTWETRTRDIPKTGTFHRKQ